MALHPRLCVQLCCSTSSSAPLVIAFRSKCWTLGFLGSPVLAWRAIVNGVEHNLEIHPCYAREPMNQALSVGICAQGFVWVARLEAFHVKEPQKELIGLSRAAHGGDRQESFRSTWSRHAIPSACRTCISCSSCECGRIVTKRLQVGFLQLRRHARSALC